MKRFVAFMLVLLLGVPFLTGCDDPVEITFNGFIPNASKADAWIWLGHDELTDASKMAPGDMKMVTVTLKGIQRGGYRRVNDTIKVNSSTDGKKQSTEKLAVSVDIDDEAAVPNIYVRFDGKGCSVDFGQ